MLFRYTTWCGLDTHCDARPCCSPSSCVPGKPCRYRWRASHLPAAPRWGGTVWGWPGWRCSFCGPPWTRRWRRWGKCCPLADCPVDTRSRGRAPRTWQGIHSPPWHFAPGKLDKKTSEGLVEGRKTCTRSSLEEIEETNKLHTKTQNGFRIN